MGLHLKTQGPLEQFRTAGHFPAALFASTVLLARIGAGGAAYGFLQFVAVAATKFFYGKLK